MKYRIDEAAEMQPQVQRVNQKKVRVYFDHHTEEREGTDGKITIVHIAKFVEVESQESDAVVLAKIAVQGEITEYDNSSAVNEFTFNGQKMWLPREMRSMLRDRLELDKSQSLTTTKLIYEGVVIELPIVTAEAMLTQLEVYARDCFDKTNEHAANVSQLDNVDNIVNYDYTLGYPPKLVFDLAE